MSSPAANSGRSLADAAPATLHSQIDLLAVLGKALHRVGLPAHRLEELLVQTAARLGLDLNAFSLPTGLMMCVDAEPAPVTVLIRVEPGTVHLEQMARLSTVVERLARGSLTVGEAQRRVERIMNAPPRWGRFATLLAYVLSGGAFAVFFGGAAAEVATGTLVGFAVGLLSIFFQQVRLSRSLFDLAAAAVAAFIANLASTFDQSFVEWIPLAAGLIILLPGLPMVDAIEELAHGHYTSGSARLAGVGVTLLSMTFGAVLGIIILNSGHEEPVATTTGGLGIWAVALALAAVAGGSTIRFRARPVDFWAALAASAIALFGTRLGAYWLGQFAGPFLAALLLGLAANAYAGMSGQPAQLLTVPGLALLVPGAFGVRSMSALLSENTAAGVDTAFHMFLAAMALVTGLLLSNSLFRQVTAGK